MKFLIMINLFKPSLRVVEYVLVEEILYIDLLLGVELNGLLVGFLFLIFLSI